MNENLLSQLKQEMQYLEIQAQLDQMPAFSQRYCLELIKNSLEGCEENPLSRESIYAQNSAIYEQLKGALKSENLIGDRIIKRHMDAIQTIITSGDLESVSRKTHALRLELIHFSTSDLLNLVKKTEFAAKQIEDKDIVMLLGGTGAGKSTTLHFLAGSKITEQMNTLKNGATIKYFAPDPKSIKNEELKKVKVGPYSISETRYITPVSVNTKVLGLAKSRDIVLCDSPGFGDTSGPEVDIANSIGIVKSVRGCKSIRPVILISFKSIGDRGQGIQELARIITGLVNDFRAHQDSFIYIFTNFPENFDIHAELSKLLEKIQNSTPKDFEDSSFETIFLNMVEQTENGAIRIDFPNSIPQKILEQLINKQPIQNPEDIFQIQATESTKQKINQQVVANEKCITQSLKTHNYRLILFKLNEFQSLYGILEFASIHDTYEKSKKEIASHIQHTCNAQINLFNRQMNENDIIQVEDIDAYLSCMNQLEEAQILRTHLQSELLFTSHLINNLSAQIEGIQKLFSDPTHNDSNVVKQFAKAKTLSTRFPQVKKAYDNVCCAFREKYMAEFESCALNLEKCNFNQFFKNIARIQNLERECGAYLQAENESRHSKDLLSKFADCFLIKAKTITRILNLRTNLVDDQKKSQIKILLTQIQDADEQIKLNTHIDFSQVVSFDIKELKILKSNVHKDLLDCCKNILKRMTFSENLCELDEIEDHILLFAFIEELQLVNGFTELYLESLDKIRHFVRNQKNSDANILISNVNKYDDLNQNFEYAKLKEKINMYKQLSGLETYCKGLILKPKLSLEQRLVDHAQSLEKMLQRIRINIYDLVQLNSVQKILNIFDSMIEVDFDIPKIDEIYQKAKETGYYKINDVLDEIQQYFNILDKSLQNPQIDQIQEYIDDHKAESMILFLQSYLQCRELQQDRAKPIQNEVYKTLESYQNVIQNQFECIFQEFDSGETQSRGNNTLDQKLRIIKLRIDEIVRLKKFQKLFDLLKGEKIHEQFKQRLIDFYEDVSASKQGKKSYYLKIARSLRNNDEFMPQQYKFSLIYKQQLDQKTSQGEQIIGLIQKFMKEEKYSSVFKQLEDAGKSWQKEYYEEIEDEINQPFIQIFKKLNEKLWDPNFELHQELIKELVESLDKFDKLNTYLKEFISAEAKSAYENLKIKVFERIQRQVQIMKDLVGRKDLVIQNSKDNLHLALEMLQKFYDKEAFQKLKGDFLESDAKISGIIKKISISLEQNGISNDFLESSKSDFRNLIDAYQHQTKYSSSIKQIIDTLKQKIKQEQIDFEAIQTWDEQTKSLKKIREAIDFLPATHLDADVQKKVDQHQVLRNEKEMEIKKKQKEILQDARNPIDTKKFRDEDINEFVQKCLTEKMPHIVEEIVKIQVSQSYKFKTDILDQCESSKLANIFNTFSQQHAQYEKLGSLDTQISTNFEQSKVKIKDMLNKLIAFFEDMKERNPETSIERFNSFIVFLEQNQKYEKYFILIDAFTSHDITKVYQSISTFLINIQADVDNSYQSLSFMDMNSALFQNKLWDKFFEAYAHQIRRIAELNAPNDAIMQNTLKSYSLYSKNQKKILDKIRQVRDELLNFSLKNYGFEEERKQLYSDLKSKLNAFKSIDQIQGHYSREQLQTEGIEAQCVEHIVLQFTNANNHLLSMIKADSFSNPQLSTIKIHLENILTFEQLEVIKNYSFSSCLDAISEYIERQLENITNTITKKKENEDNISKALIRMKQLSMCMSHFTEKIDTQIDQSLSAFREANKSDGGSSLALLAAIFEKDPTGVGRQIISQFSVFKGAQICIFNQKIQKHDITYILNQMEEQKDVNRKELKNKYDKFMELYQEIVKSEIVNLSKKKITTQITENIVLKIQESTQKIKRNTKFSWVQVKPEIPNLLALIFALWTLKNSQYFQEMESLKSDESARGNYLLKPHAGQIISIFRMLGIGYNQPPKSEFGLFNNLIELGTGEGKSIVLAVTSTILALFGIQVKCACYSEQLSKRDYDSFQFLFDSLNLTQLIQYGSFTKICESKINEQYDIRQKVLELIAKPSDSDIAPKSSSSQNTKQKKILLIDEVDVFFGKDFYGSRYQPVALLKDPTIETLVRYLWSIKGNIPPLKSIFSSEEYKKCQERFRNWNGLIEESVKDMLTDLNKFDYNYFVKDDQIYVKELDTISSNIQFGYKTMFAYFHECEQKRITEQSLANNIYIRILCGGFSYAEIPREFDYIMGLTGTLKSLSSFEKNIVQNQYNIKNTTFTPSVYGKNQRKFAEKSDVFIEEEVDYFKTIVREIYKIKDQNRATLIFFSTEENLKKFQHSQEIAPIRDQIQVLTEKIQSQSERNQIIAQATVYHQITLLTRAYGRGIDFILRDKTVINNGGVHVIQTFFSEQLSEEIQIKGRCARQGEQGSYSMVLQAEDLEFLLGPHYKDEIKNIRSNNSFYEELSKKRDSFASQKFKDTDNYIQESLAEHTIANELIESINTSCTDETIRILRQINESLYKEAEPINILCLVDGTGSMGKLLEKSAQTVSTMFKRVLDILKDNGMQGTYFQMQFAVYRDYDSLIEGILNYSPWENKPEGLQKFLQSIKPKGGGDYEEAVEIGLQHANKEHKENPLSQVILIGDAPAKKRDVIKQYRKKYKGESYWEKSRYGALTDWQCEAQLLKDQNVPVNVFYLHEGAKENFLEISNKTGGKCQKLDINLPNSSDILTDIVSIQILSSVSKSKGEGDSDELVQAYTKKYVKSYA